MHNGRRRLGTMLAAFALSAGGTAAMTVAVASDRQPPPAPPMAGVLEPPLTAGATAPDPGPDPAADETGPTLVPSDPVAVDIPAIGVQSVVGQVGLTPEHTMEVPAGAHYDEAAWYRHSATPGSPGAAVIVGHVDSAARGPSVFFELGSLLPGDEILVTRDDGVTAVFRVEGLGRYPKDDFPTALVYGDGDRALLRLVTCGGAFDRAAGTYRDNLVVFARLVASRS
ncbi:MAG: class F sortase [Egibacteraceae bacterium]